MFKLIANHRTRKQLIRIDENLDRLQAGLDLIRYENSSNAKIQLDMDRYQQTINTRRERVMEQMRAI